MPTSKIQPTTLSSLNTRFWNSATATIATYKQNITDVKQCATNGLKHASIPIAITTGNAIALTVAIATRDMLSDSIFSFLMISGLCLPTCVAITCSYFSEGYDDEYQKQQISKSLKKK